jgi:hypothetical protein
MGKKRSGPSARGLQISRGKWVNERISSGSFTTIRRIELPGREEPYKVPTPQEMEERKRQEEAKAVAYEKQQRLVGQVARAPPHPGEQIGDSSQDTTHTGVCWACRRKREEGRCSGESPKCSQCIKGDIE